LGFLTADYASIVITNARTPGGQFVLHEALVRW
jgi:hypothetical protein